MSTSPPQFSLPSITVASYTDSTSDKMGEIVVCKQQCTEVSK